MASCPIDAADRINLKYGRRTAYIGPMHYAVGRIDDSISFGSTCDVHRLMEELGVTQDMDDTEQDAFFEDWPEPVTAKEMPVRSRIQSRMLEL